MSDQRFPRNVIFSELTDALSERLLRVSYLCSRHFGRVSRLRSAPRGLGHFGGLSWCRPSRNSSWCWWGRHFWSGKGSLGSNGRAVQSAQWGFDRPSLLVFRAPGQLGTSRGAPFTQSALGSLRPLRLCWETQAKVRAKAAAYSSVRCTVVPTFVIRQWKEAKLLPF